MKRLVLSGVPAILLVSLAAAAGAVSQNWGPNGDGTLTHQDDLRWVEFHDTRIAADDKAGIYHASFGTMLQKMNNQPIVITGYMLPVRVNLASPHFVLTRRSSSCPFCPANEPTEAIEVFSQKAVSPTPSPVTVQGRLHLIASSEQGLFFRIDNATVY